MNLLKNNLIGEVGAPIALANNTDSNSDILDMSGYDGVCFIAPVEDSVQNGIASLKVEQDDANADGGMAALAGATATKTCVITDDLNNKLLIVDVYKPTKRYVQGVRTSSAANIAFGTLIAIRYNGSKCPITADSTVLHGVSVFGPAES
jgi:hypothetical protein